MRLHLVLPIVFVISLCSYGWGLLHGYDHGAKQLHRGVLACQTLPDDSVYCWEVKK